MGGVDLGVDGAPLAVLQRDDLLGLAEIDTAGEFAHDHDVEALDQLALERGGFGQRRIAHGGAQIGEEAEILAQAQKARFRTRLIGNISPFRAADRTEHHRVGLVGELHGVLGDRLAMGIIGGAADQILFRLEGGETGLVEKSDQAFDLRHHLDTDAVARKKEELLRRHDLSPLIGMPAD